MKRGIIFLAIGLLVGFTVGTMTGTSIKSNVSQPFHDRQTTIDKAIDLAASGSIYL